MKRKRKVSRSLGDEVRTLRNALRLSQPELAAKLGVTRSALSACEIGRLSLPPLALAKLAKLALNDDQKLFFVEQMGLDEQMIADLAKSIFGKLLRPPKPEETVTLPKYVVDGLCLKESGKNVPLPAESVPNPASTICLSVEGTSDGPVAAPRGLYLVDRSRGGSDELRSMLHRVVVLSFVTPERVVYGPSGIYIGRVWMQAGAWRDREGVSLRHSWSLALLSSGIHVPHLDLCTKGAALAFDVPQAREGSRAFNIIDLHEWVEEHPKDRRSLEDAERALRMDARLPAGSEVLGEVIGRLTGHIKQEPQK